MEAIYVHHGHAGPITVQVSAGDLPIRVCVVNPGSPAEAHVVAPDAGAAQVGPSGVGGQNVSVNVGRSAGRLTRLLGGASVSRGSVRASGRRSVACGGDLVGIVVNGNGNGNTISGQRRSPRAPGVYLTVAHGSRLDLRSCGAVTVFHSAAEMSLDKAIEIGLLKA